MIRIDIKPLTPGIHEFTWEVDAEGLNLDAGLFDDMHVMARIDFYPTRIFVTVHTQAVAHLVCDRTLVDFDEVVRGEYSVLFSSDDSFREEERRESDDDVRFLAPEVDEIDLTDIVRDTFMLSLPVRRIAPGAEAKEIPLEFGAPDEEGYIDPRWEALRELKSKPDDTAQE